MTKGIKLDKKHQEGLWEKSNLNIAKETVIGEEQKKTQRLRCVCITFWKKPIFPEIVQYLIAGEEICPDTKRVHWQSYAEFRGEGKTIKQIAEAFEDKQIKVFNRRGTQMQAINYCKKDNKFEEFGEMKKQGERTDLCSIAEQLVDGGLTLEEVMVEHPTLYCKYRNGLKDLAGLGQKKQAQTFREINTEVYWGEAGCGKTRKAVEENPDHYVLDMDGEGKVWFDGYNGESTLILDDFYGGIKYSYLLRLLDGYACRLAVKGSFTYARWNKVIITSNKPPHDWYHHGLTPALKRRLTKTTQM